MKSLSLQDLNTCLKQAHKSSVIDFNIQLVLVASSITISFGRAFIFFIPVCLTTPPLQEKIAIAISYFIITYQDFFTIYFSESNQNRTIFRTINCQWTLKRKCDITPRFISPFLYSIYLTALLFSLFTLYHFYLHTQQKSPALPDFIDSLQRQRNLCRLFNLIEIMQKL